MPIARFATVCKPGIQSGPAFLYIHVKMEHPATVALNLQWQSVMDAKGYPVLASATPASPHGDAT